MFARLTPVALTLIVANVAIYLLQSGSSDQLFEHFALWPLASDASSGAPVFHMWQLVSYAFLHGSGSHLFFNMFALYMFGSDVERVFGRNRFILYYFVCVISAAAAQLLVAVFAGGDPYPTVGASGGIFGILLAFGMFFPQRRILLLIPPIPLPAWLFVTLYGVIELAMGVTGFDSSVAHFAHLGGMAGGYLLIQRWRGARQQ
jgi:membrane associated rhomboid family serine protease